MSDSPTKALPFGVSFRSLALAAVGVAFLAAGVEMASTTSCAPAATNNPLRSFEDARDIDVICMQTLSSQDGGGIPPVPLPQAACTPVPTGVTGALLPNHLFALVTQVKRGEVAVVDLTAGAVINEDLGSPGINFLPVGQIPTGIASAPDGRMSYVAAAEVNKPAIYGLPSTQILGNSQGLEAGRSPVPPLLTTWPACALPQTPGSITIIPNLPPEPTVAGSADGGAGSGDAGAGASDGGASKTDGGEKSDASASKTDAGASGGSSGATGNPAGYVLAVVLPGTQEGVPARVITVDPMPLLRGGGVAVDGGDSDGDSGTDPPGQLPHCRILGESPLSNQVADAGAGSPWPDGVKWLDAALDAPVPPASATCTNASGGDAGTAPPNLPNPSPQPTAAARAGQFLYVADGALPLIHVFDISSATHPREIAPLRATSLAQPKRVVTISTLAVSPPTRDYKRFLYAVDATDSPASIIVYDITDPVNSPHVPMRRPHSNLVPLQPEDRITFTAGVSALAFVQHDWPLAQTPGGALITGAASTGLLCNPNPNVDQFALDASADAQNFTDPGANYRYSSLAFADEPLGPTRLRGIFAFATLSSGQVMTIDVDDWDAPCRRPQLMEPQDAGNDVRTSGYTNAITPPEPAAATPDAALDPYEAPFTGVTNGTTWVSDEVFFPVSAPHRPRSNYLLSNNTSLGVHFPYIVSAPQLFSAGPDGGLGASVTGSVAEGNPVLLPTATTFPDPSALPDGGLGVRLAFEDPLAHIDQGWTIDYEGPLASFGNVAGDLVPFGGEGLNSQRPAYYTLFVSTPGGALCSRGVEDWTIGQGRAAAYLAEAKARNLQAPEQLASWLGDYIQVTDQLLPSTDPYWASDPEANQPNDCWAGFNGSDNPPLTNPTDRYNTCSNIFAIDGNESISLDFPIVQAFDDGLVITRFNYPAAAGVAASTSNRLITPPDPTNVTALKQLACCFHGQMAFNVRTGGEWVTSGGASGYLHHMTVDPATGRCVTSCDPEKALLNSRALGIAPVTQQDGGASFAPDRDSPLAMRNPTFSFFIQHALAADPNLPPATAATSPFVVARPARDFVWQFALKGQLAPLSINLASTNSSVSPQSMLFIPSLGQLAVIDGSQQGQGLILIDLNAVAVTGNTYY